MTFLRACFSGLGAFGSHLLHRTAGEKGLSANGHVIMDGWPFSPQEEVIRKFQVEKSTPHRGSRVTLYGLAGSHAGEYFPLANSVELLGTESECSLVLTPVASAHHQRYRLFINGVVRMLAENGSYFRLNGTETEQAELFDYDEIEVLGNRMLVLMTPQGSKGAVHE